jgi:hypothetical protein
MPVGLMSVVGLSSLGHVADPDSHHFGMTAASESSDGSGSVSTQNLGAVEAQNGAMDDHARSQGRRRGSRSG